MTVEVQVSNTDSAPYGNVIKTYSQENGAKVMEIRYVHGNATALVINDGNAELPLVFNRKQTITQGASCYDIGK